MKLRHINNTAHPMPIVRVDQRRRLRVTVIVIALVVLPVAMLAVLAAVAAAQPGVPGDVDLAIHNDDGSVIAHVELTLDARLATPYHELVATFNIPQVPDRVLFISNGNTHEDHGPPWVLDDAGTFRGDAASIEVLWFLPDDSTRYSYEFAFITQAGGDPQHEE